MSNHTANAPPIASKPDLAAIKKTLGLLFKPGDTVELRALGKNDRGYQITVSGYFHDLAKLAEYAEQTNRYGNVYVTLNPVKPELLSRRCNRAEEIRGKDPTTADKDILCRRLLLIDLDADRASGISADDGEHQAALYKADEVRRYLVQNLGWPEPIYASSGNGGHLLFKIDLPADDGGIVRRILGKLAERFTDEAVKVDQAVYNPARICKLYGTVGKKGDSTADRPHRLSQLLHVPDVFSTVPAEKLLELAGESENKPAPASKPSNGTFNAEDFLQRHGVEVTHKGSYSNSNGAAYKWDLATCPLCGESDRSAVVLGYGDGKLGFKCHHNRCTGLGWKDFRNHFEPGYRDRQNFDGTHGLKFPEEATRPKTNAIRKFTVNQLVKKHPQQRPAVIEGILRVGETGNIVCAPKFGKSFMVTGLGICITQGRPWLDRFPTAQGRVLLIDNELHVETLSQRIPWVAAAIGAAEAAGEDNGNGGRLEGRFMPVEKYGEDFHVWALRGNLRSLAELEAEFDQIEPGYYKLVILDAKYRFALAGSSENDNAAEAQIYNLLDKYAEKLQAAFIIVHHTSKGTQSGKGITDVGAGAGAQSRAVDAHVVLRDHEQDRHVVLDAAVRSFPPVTPIVLRWEFPLMIPTDEDPKSLRDNKPMNEQRQMERDKQASNEIIKALLDGPATTSRIREKTGLSRDRAGRLLNILMADSQIEADEIEVRGNKCNEYYIPESDD